MELTVTVNNPRGGIPSIRGMTHAGGEKKEKHPAKQAGDNSPNFRAAAFHVANSELAFDAVVKKINRKAHCATLAGRKTASNAQSRHSLCIYCPAA
jgi:hypothetical protein